VGRGNRANVIGIRAFPRIHVTLLALHDGGYRVNGGVGFGINAPAFEVLARPADSLQIRVDGPGSVDEATQRYIEGRLQNVFRIHDLKRSVEVAMRVSERSHLGLGSSTALTLAALEVCLRSNDQSISREALVGLSGRGGTSGVGIFSYFDGGMSLDFGRVADGPEPFLPSEDTIALKPPLRVGRTDMKAAPIGLLVPSHIAPKSTQEERQFFRDTCPLPRADTLEALYHAGMGVYAAAVEQNDAQFYSAINAVQECAWKQAEIRLYGDEVLACLDIVRSSGANAAGMSSLGPMVYFFSEQFGETCSLLQERLPKWRLIRTSPRNQGREVFDA